MLIVASPRIRVCYFNILIVDIFTHKTEFSYSIASFVVSQVYILTH